MILTFTKYAGPVPLLSESFFPESDLEAGTIALNYFGAAPLPERDEYYTVVVDGEQLTLIDFLKRTEMI